MHVRNTCGYYGAERCIVSWVRESVRRGHSASVAYFTHPDDSVSDFVAAVREAGATSVHPLARSHVHLPQTMGTLLGVVKAENVDVIHAHENRSHLVGGAVARMTGCAVVGTLHGYVVTGTKSRWWARANGRLLSSRWLSHVTVPTKSLQQAVPRAVWVPNALPESRAAGPLAAEAPPAPATFGVVARLSREKGVHVFLNSLETLPKSWRFVVIGAGPEAQALKRHREAGRVEWMGFRPDAAERMRQLTALVLPSLSEGLPLTLLEAAAQGVPIVATAVGGIPEVVENGHTGRLVQPQDPAALAAAMRDVVADPNGTRRLAEGARARFLDTHTLERAGERLEVVYAEAVERRA